ncbi:hypothetical protein GG344DRAFT_69408 [Lentinula edodes]|nr:hypothetical protein GG344DRAFT_69408 [Lentinula edodes]
MMTHFGRTANLQVILNHNTDLQQKIAEALTALKDIDREDHRGMFAGTDLSAWSSTEFKATPACIDEATLARIVTCLCELYTVPRSYWENKISRQARTSNNDACHGSMVKCHFTFCQDGFDTGH